MISPDLNNQYQQICGEHVEFTDLLFGNDLPKQIHDISATNRVGQKLSSGGRLGGANMNNPYPRNTSRTGGTYNPNFRLGLRWQKPPFFKERKFNKDFQKHV